MADSDALRTLLAGSMRDARRGQGVPLADLAARIGVSKGYLSEAERGIKPPSPRIVRAYDLMLGFDGVLIGLLEDYQVTLGLESSSPVPDGPARARPRRVPGDAVEFVAESPDAVELVEGRPHLKTWTVRNSGSVTWAGRELRRTGRLGGREVPESVASVPIARTEPGEIVTYEVLLHCAREAGTRIVRFKMYDADGHLCFPEDEYGVTVEVTSRPGPG